MLFLCFLSVFTTVIAGAYDPVKCLIPKIYAELGCKALFDDNSDCPTRFDCGFLSTRDSTKCYFKNVAYNVGDQLEDDPRNPCIVACMCSGFGSEVPSWSCAVYDCAWGPEGDNCYSQYSLDSCCPHNYCYPPGGDPPIAKCEYNGKIYLEGQYIETNLPCANCICQPGFDGTLDGPWCREVHCGIEQYNSAELRRGCVPVYFNTPGCCPFEFRCPAYGDSVIKSGDTSSDYKCTFGDLTLNLGDKLSPSEDECTKCSCEVPPLVTCVQEKREECGK